MPCPVCDRPVMPERCEPWFCGGAPPWHVGCFSYFPHEHYVGVNGDDEADTIRAWNAEVSKIKQLDFERGATEFLSLPKRD